MKKVRFLVAATFGFAASFVLAEVQIVDRPVGGQTNSVTQSGSAATVPSAPLPVVTTTTVDASVESPSQANSPVVRVSSAKPNPAAEMFYQMQVMQQELLELRGLIEEQAHQIKQLKQQRLDDYVDLDRRLSSLSVGSAPEGASVAGSVQDQSQVISGSARSSLPVNDEKAHYQSAIDPIIGKVKNLDLAISLLHEHLERFPSGQFAGNAKYWLGESYLVKDNIAESRKWFESLLNEYPLHGKVPAAKYKLGIVYHKLGMNAQAKVMLEEVRDNGGPAAGRAADYLDANL